MDVERPLEEFVKESLRQKRAERTERRKTSGPRRSKRTSAATAQPSSGLAAAPPLNSTEAAAPRPAASTDAEPSKAADPLRRRSAIAKKRRVRKRSLPDSRKPASQQPQQPAASPPAAPPLPSRHQNHHHNQNHPQHNDPPASPPLSHHVPYNAPRDRSVKVAVSNLHVGVTQDDIRELFETVGSLQTASLFKYDNGSSKGEAEVVFDNMQDALEAIKRYNQVPLDNQPLQITLVTNHTASRGRRSSQSYAAAPSKSHADEPYDSRHSPRSADHPYIPDNSPDRHGAQPPASRRGQRRRGRRAYNRPSSTPDDRPLSPERSQRHMYD